MTDRAAQLARIADAFMANGCAFCTHVLPPGMRRLRAEAYPPGQPREIRFAAEWPRITIVCSRPLP
jgi:hypothetical protein